MTLRIRLSLIIGTAVSLSILLTLVLTSRNVRSYVMETEETHFRTMADSITAELESSFQEYLSARIRLIQSTKQNLRMFVSDVRSAVMAVEQALQDPAPDTERIERLVLHQERIRNAEISGEDVHVFLEQASALGMHGLPRLGLSQVMTSLKQQSFQEIVSGLDRDGEFSLWLKDGVFQLLFFLPLEFSGQLGPLGSDRILVGHISLNTLLEDIENLRRSRLHAVRADIERLRLYDQGCILLLDAEGRTVYERGASPVRAFLTSLCDRTVRSGRLVLHETEDDTYLCHVAYVPAYSWYIVMSAPVSEMLSSACAVLYTLILAGLAVMLTAVGLGLHFSWKALQPLQKLTAYSREVSALDFTDPAVLEQMDSVIRQELDFRRHDEAGLLAESFATMGRTLVRNIQSTMRVMTEQKRLEGELAAARDIQLGILPGLSEAGPVPHLRVQAFLEPAREVGGDLYDCFVTPDGRCAIAIGDVSGKGVPAALFMTMTVTLIRHTLGSGRDPASAMTEINALLEKHNSSSMFVTLLLLLYDPVTGEITYSNGGHCPPCIVGPDGTVRSLEELSGPLVGAVPDISFRLCRDRLADGETCLIYTDGVTEAMNAEKELFGTERLVRCLQRSAHCHPHGLVEAVFSDIRAFRKEELPSDDIALLAFQRV